MTPTGAAVTAAKAQTRVQKPPSATSELPQIRVGPLGNPQAKKKPLAAIPAKRFVAAKKRPILPKRQTSQNLSISQAGVSTVNGPANGLAKDSPVTLSSSVLPNYEDMPGEESPEKNDKNVGSANATSSLFTKSVSAAPTAPKRSESSHDRQSDRLEHTIDRQHSTTSSPDAARPPIVDSLIKTELELSSSPSDIGITSRLDEHPERLARQQPQPSTDTLLTKTTKSTTNAPAPSRSVAYTSRSSNPPLSKFPGGVPLLMGRTRSRDSTTSVETTLSSSLTSKPITAMTSDVSVRGIMIDAEGGLTGMQTKTLSKVPAQEPQTTLSTPLIAAAPSPRLGLAMAKGRQRTNGKEPAVSTGVASKPVVPLARTKSQLQMILDKNKPRSGNRTCTEPASS